MPDSKGKTERAVILAFSAFLIFLLLLFLWFIKEDFPFLRAEIRGKFPRAGEKEEKPKKNLPEDISGSFRIKADKTFRQSLNSAADSRGKSAEK